MFEKNTMLGCLSCRTLALICGLSLASASYGADEDIDIPYTDTYGYVYDPATGTFIKQDNPANPAAGQAQDISPPVSDAMATIEPPANTGTMPQDDAPAMQSGSALMPALLLALIIAFAFAYRFMARPKQSAHEQN